MADAPLPKGTVTQIVSGATNTITPTGGTAIATGDTMVLAMQVLASSPAPVAPSGWTLRTSTTLNSRVAYVWTKNRAAGEGGYEITRTSGGSAAMSLTWFPPSNVIAGTGKLRNTAPAEDKTVTIPAIATTVANTLVLGIAFEATTTAEAFEPTLSGGTKFAFVAQVGSTNIETILLGYSVMASAGTSSPMTATYPNSQSLNGYGYVLALEPISTTPAPTPISIEYWNSLSVVEAEVFYWDGSSLKEIDSVLTLPTEPITVAQWLAQKPSYMLHRGGSASWTEHTRDAVTRGVWLGGRNIEMSVWFSSDKVPFCVHDPDLGFMTNGTDTRRVDSLTAAELDLITITRNGSGEKLMRLEWVLQKYGKTHVVTVEDKSYANMTSLIQLLDLYGGPTRFMIKCFGAGGTAQMVLPNSKGYKSWAYFYTKSINGTSATPPEAVPEKAAFYTTIGIPWNSTQDEYTAALSLGIPLVVHIVPSAEAAAEAKTKGGSLVGMQISNPLAVIPRYNNPLT